MVVERGRWDGERNDDKADDDNIHIYILSKRKMWFKSLAIKKQNDSLEVDLFTMITI